MDSNSDPFERRYVKKESSCQANFHKFQKHLLIQMDSAAIAKHLTEVLQFGIRATEHEKLKFQLDKNASFKHVIITLEYISYAGVQKWQKWSFCASVLLNRHYRK